jgi:putative ABC transport system substrate-binding protein
MFRLRSRFLALPNGSFEPLRCHPEPGPIVKRRTFFKWLGSGVGLAATGPTRGQRTILPVIGFLHSESPSLLTKPLEYFRLGLAESGYRESQNVAIEYRWAEGRNEVLSTLATDLVQRNVKVIVTPGTTPASLAAKAATSTIPIVFFTAGDPVALGLVKSLNQPGGNATGVTSLGSELLTKRLALMHELLPDVRVMCLLVNQSNAALRKPVDEAIKLTSLPCPPRSGNDPFWGHWTRSSYETDCVPRFSLAARSQSARLAYRSHGWIDAMRRRDFIKVIAGSATTWPLTVAAQQPSRKIPRIGWLVPTPEAEQENLEEYRRGMLELGYVEGRTVATTYLYSGGDSARLDKHAAVLVTEKVDIIVTFSTPGCLAAKRATSSIPTVFAASSDPLSTGIVTSLGHPGGNITGLSVMATDLSAKRLELLQMVVPSIHNIAVLWDSSNPGMALRVRETKLAAEQLHVAFLDSGASDLNGLEASFTALSKQRPEALLVTAEPFTRLHRDRILDFTMKNRIPAIYEDGGFLRAGGLISYGPHIPSLFHSAAGYVDKILKGAKPADLPVEQPTKFLLIINVETAKALNLEIPSTLLARADEVIE